MKNKTYYSKMEYWVTTKIGINGLYLNLYQNKHRIHLEYVNTIKRLKGVVVGVVGVIGVYHK
jgi:hypothetical protein